jgi:osmotically inducible protein OsmC
MIKLEKVLYTAKAHTTGGRDDGTSCTDDGRLQVTLSRPGMPGNGTNPEQLFAAGYSACFLSAIKLIAGKRKIALPGEPYVDAEVDLGTIRGGVGLAVRLNVGIPAMDHETAQSLVDAASHVCPYSLATSGNIDVRYSLITSEPVERVTETQHT